MSRSPSHRNVLLGTSVPTAKIIVGDLFSDTDDLAMYKCTSVTPVTVVELSAVGSPGVHALGGSDHSADTLANLNSKVSDATLVDTDDIVLKTLLDAYSILYADTDNTPAALAVANSRLVGRKATGGIVALTPAEIVAIISGTIKGGDVELSEIGSATYDDLQNFINNTLSAGRTSGGVIEASGASGDIKVNLGTGFIKIADTAISETKSFDWSDTVISAGVNAGDIIDKDVNYIYIDYNAGEPVPKATTNRTTISLNTMFTLGRVYRDDTTLHIINSGIKLYNHTRDNHERLIQVRGFERASGGVIAEEGIRYLTSTGGIFFLGANKLTTAQQDTSPGDTPSVLTRWYHDADEKWVSNTGIEGASAAGQISNEHYDTGTALDDIGTARYGVFWIFIHFDGDLHVVYGRGSYKLADAENATVPALPDAVSEFSTLAAKIIVKQEDPNFTSIVSAYETLFPVSSPPNHNDLGDMDGGQADEYYHLTSAEYTELQAGADIGGLYGINVETLTGNKTLTPGTDEIYQYLDAGGANRIITLATATASAGDRFVIRYNGTYSDVYSLEMKQAAISLDKIYAGGIKEFIFDGTDWVSRGIGTGENDDKKLNVAIGTLARANERGTAIGNNASAYTNAVAIGLNASGYARGVAIGYASTGQTYGVGIGYFAAGQVYGVAVGANTKTNSKKYSIALGRYSETERVGETSVNINADDTDQENNVVQGRWARDTADDTPLEIFCAGQASERFTIRVSSVLAFTMLIVARDNVANEVARYSVSDGLIKRDAAGNTTMVSCTVVTDYEDDATWGVAVTADDTNEALIITVTGDATNPVQWAAVMDGVETHF